MVTLKKLLPDKKTLLVFLIFAAAVFIRIQYIRHTRVNNHIRGDAREYVAYGYNLFFNKTFTMQRPTESLLPDSHRTPGYPLLIAFAFNFGVLRLHLTVLYMQAVLSALLAVMTYYIGIRFLPYLYAVAGSLFVAFSPHLVAMSGYLLSETLFSFMLLAGVMFFYQALRRKRYILFMVSAFFFGYAHLTTPTSFFIPLILTAFVLVFRGFTLNTIVRKNLLKHLVIFLMVYSLFPIGWGIRNKVNVPPGAMKGSGRLMTGLAYGAYPGYEFDNPENKYFPYRDDPQWEEFRGSLGGFTNIFIERFKQRPLRFIVWYLFEKPYLLWGWNILQGQGDVYVYPVLTSLYQQSEPANLTREAMKIIHPVVQLLMLAGLPLFIFTFRSSRLRNNSGMLSDTPIFILAIILYYTLMFMVLGPLTRYAVPLRPQQYLWALWSLHTGIVLIRNRLPNSGSSETETGISGKTSRKKGTRHKRKKTKYGK